MKDVSGFLLKQAESASNKELSELWREIQEYHQKRLWHQLTQDLLTLVQRPEVQDGALLFDLYENVISDFEIRLNPLCLVQICTPIVQQFKEKEEALQFLHKLGDKVKANTEALALTKVLCGFIQLHHYKDLEKTKEYVEEVELLMNDIDGVGFVHGQYYMLESELHKIEGDHAGYYRASLRFLGCTPLETLSKDDLASQAFCLSLAALLGKDIFNFGELLAHPILEHLKGTANEWVVELLLAFNAGDVEAYTKMKPKWKAVVDLKKNEEVLYEKVCLLALMEMTFRRSSNERQLLFADIAKMTKLEEDKVELLVMKALSKGLVKGTIDQVSQNVNMTWVQPRVLDNNQLRTLMSKVSNLTNAIGFMEGMIERNAGEILTV